LSEIHRIKNVLCSHQIPYFQRKELSRTCLL
jgi:hypothetical protein